MDKKDIANAKDPDLRASMNALRRASGLAIQTAIQTNTAIVIMEEGKIVRISGEDLHRRQSVHSSLQSYPRPEDESAPVASESNEISRLSEPSLAKVWDNEEDAAYDSLEIDPSGNRPASTES